MPFLGKKQEKQLQKLFAMFWILQMDLLVLLIGNN